MTTDVSIMFKSIKKDLGKKGGEVKVLQVEHNFVIHMYRCDTQICNHQKALRKLYR